MLHGYLILFTRSLFGAPAIPPFRPAHRWGGGRKQAWVGVPAELPAPVVVLVLERPRILGSTVHKGWGK